MRSVIFFVIVVLAGLFGFSQWKTQHSTTSSSSAHKKPFLVAHRGDEQNFPENSTDAFVSGARVGADYVEMDIRRTKDGIFVIHHDDDTGRSVFCDQGEVPIAKATFSYIATACRYRDLNGDAAKVLTLAEALNLMKTTSTGVVLDVKPVIKEADLPDLAVELLKLDPDGGCQRGISVPGTFNCFANLIIYVNDLQAHDKLWRQVKGLEEADPKWRTLGAMTFLKIAHSAKSILQDETYMNNDGVAFNFVASDKEDVKKLRSLYPSKLLVAWTLATPEQFESARSLKMDGIITSKLSTYLSK
ncbi:glycerophosphodiester phosphodiesterase [Bdellovibrio sp. HCB337]|uniref:glycerophosphodiester phosphodiesterase n=1 Tax=Bdellovibrio sp. HCB337 TaxID=3394358 RepID=UPI0039A407B9